MSCLLTEVIDDNILLVKLNRPESLNALAPELVIELVHLFRELNNNRQVRSVIITGQGAGFCAGADLKQNSGPGTIPGTEGMGQVGYVYKHQELLAECMLAIHECDKPIIAAVNGAAVGGGLAIALAADLRVASAKARFGAVFIKVGLSACDVGVSYFLPRLIHPTKAAELMLSGRIFDAQEAESLGLLNALVEPEQLLENAVELARSINANNEYGVWMTKKGFRSSLDAPSLRHVMEMENRTQVLGYFSGNMEEAKAAFIEKRPPKWKSL